MFELGEQKVRFFSEKNFIPLLVWTSRAISGGVFFKKFLSFYSFGQRVVKCTPISVGLREISSKKFLPKNQSLHSFAQGVSKWTPIFGLFWKISLIFFNPFTCLNWEEKNRGYFWKISSKNFFLHLFGIESHFDTLFQIIFLEIIFTPSLSPSEIGFCTP